MVRPPQNGAPLPYNANDGRVVEKQINDLGEVSDLPPGKSGSLTVRLVPGTYLLICNQAEPLQGGDVDEAHCDSMMCIRPRASTSRRNNHRSAKIPATLC